jgi:DNA replication protein DnaC
MSQNLALVDTEKHGACSLHGAYTSQITETSKLTGVPRWSGCPQCEREREEHWKALQIEEARQLHEQRLSAAAIPLRFADASFDNYEAKTESQRRIVRGAISYGMNFEDHFAAGRCMIYSGKVGTGKTHLACAILRDIIARPFGDPAQAKTAKWHPVRYATVSGVIRAIRETWNNSELREADAIKKFTRPHLLVLDEVGRQFGSDAEKTQIEEILDMRYQEMKPTIVCTNVGDKGQLTTFLGERGFDRLRENGGIMSVFDWSSHRGEE